MSSCVLRFLSLWLSSDMPTVLVVLSSYQYVSGFSPQCGQVIYIRTTCVQALRLIPPACRWDRWLPLWSVVVIALEATCSSVEEIVNTEMCLFINLCTDISSMIAHGAYCQYCIKSGSVFGAWTEWNLTWKSRRKFLADFTLISSSGWFYSGWTQCFFSFNAGLWVYGL